MPIKIREERSSDVDSIREVNRLAFGQETEGNIVDALRSNDALLLSLVATQNDWIVGHAAYSPAIIAGRVTGAALGPMAVLPDYQQQGIGSRLIASGNRMLETAGCPFIVVLGHPEYYLRFGFKPASAHGIRCEWPAPNEAFMLLVLDDNAMRDVSGLATYRDEFWSVT